MITTNLTLTNGVTSETPVVVTGITFEVDSKLAVNPATTFPFTVAIDSSVVVGIDFDETVNAGDYAESLTVNTLGGNHDIVHAVTIDDTTFVCDSGLIEDGCFDGDVLSDKWSIGYLTATLEDDRMKVVTDSDSGYVRYLLDATVGTEYEFSFDAVAGTNVGYQYSVHDYTNGTDTIPKTPYDPASGRISFTFTATGVDTRIYMLRDGFTTVGDCYFDNVSLKEVATSNRLVSSTGNPITSDTGNYLVSTTGE